MRRSRKELEHDISQYYVFTRDGLTVACGQLRKCVAFSLRFSFPLLACVCTVACGQLRKCVPLPCLCVNPLPTPPHHAF